MRGTSGVYPWSWEGFRLGMGEAREARDAMLDCAVLCCAVLCLDEGWGCGMWDVVVWCGLVSGRSE